MHACTHTAVLVYNQLVEIALTSKNETLTSHLRLARFLEFRPSYLHQPQSDWVFVGEALIGRIDHSIDLEHGNVPYPVAEVEEIKGLLKCTN